MSIVCSALTSFLLAAIVIYYRAERVVVFGCSADQGFHGGRTPNPLVCSAPPCPLVCVQRRPAGQSRHGSGALLAGIVLGQS